MIPGVECPPDLADALYKFNAYLEEAGLDVVYLCVAYRNDEGKFVTSVGDPDVSRPVTAMLTALEQMK